MMKASRRMAAVVANVQSDTSRRALVPTPRPRESGCQPEAERGLMPFRAEPGHGAQQAIRGGVDDGERRAGAVSPHRQRVLDEGVGIGGQEGLRDRHPAGDLRVLADGEQLGCIVGTPRSEDELVDRQGRSWFAVHRTALS